MKKRPALKKGDVCRLSKKARRVLYTFAKYTFVVNSFRGDSSEGRTKIKCVYVDGMRTYTVTLKRNQLWFTGRNNGVASNTMEDTHTSVAKCNVGAANNNGMDVCLVCSRPTVVIQGAFSYYNICNNPRCDWYKN